MRVQMHITSSYYITTLHHHITSPRYITTLHHQYNDFSIQLWKQQPCQSTGYKSCTHTLASMTSSVKVRTRLNLKNELSLSVAQSHVLEKHTDFLFWV